MMLAFATPTRELIRILHRHGIRFEVTGDRLQVVAVPTALEAFPGLKDALRGRKAELITVLAEERSEPLTGYDYTPLPGPVTPWPDVPFRVPKPCSRCHRIAWPDDGAARLVTGDIVCSFCLSAADLEAGAVIISTLEETNEDRC